MVQCEIHGRRLVAEWHDVKSSMRTKVAYYHCCNSGGCKGAYVRLEYLEEAVADLFKSLQFKQEFIDMVVQEATKYVADIQGNNISKKVGLENKIKALEQKRNKLENFLLDGTVSKEMFNRQHQGVQKDIDAMYRQIIDCERERGIDITVVEEILYLAKNIYTNYISVPDQLKRRYIMLFFEKIAVKDKKISQVIYRPLFASLLEQQTAVILRDNWLPRVDSDH